jgi:hypothetical protein
MPSGPARNRLRSPGRTSCWRGLVAAQGRSAEKSAPLGALTQTIATREHRRGFQPARISDAMVVTDSPSTVPDDHEGGARQRRCLHQSWRHFRLAPIRDCGRWRHGDKPPITWRSRSGKRNERSLSQRRVTSDVGAQRPFGMAVVDAEIVASLELLSPTVSQLVPESNLQPRDGSQRHFSLVQVLFTAAVSCLCRAVIWRISG